MTSQTDSQYYERAAELAEAGQYRDALECIQQHLRIAPHDAQAHNDAGAILHCLGRSDEAIDYLNRANCLQGQCPQIIWNLAEACLAAGRAGEAADLFGQMEQMSLLNPDLLNRAATSLLDQDRKGQAVDVLLRSQRLWPDQEILSPILDIVRSRRPRVFFFGDLAEPGGFLSNVFTFVKERFNAEHCSAHQVDQVYEQLRPGDICWFDCCDTLLAEFSHKPKICKSIVSISGLPSDGQRIRSVRWENIDILAIIGNWPADELLAGHVADIRHRTRLVPIPLGVDVGRRRFAARPRGKNLACLDRLDISHNPMLLLQCMQKLHFVDPQYRLHFAGVARDPALRRYLNHMVAALGLTGVVVFDEVRVAFDNWSQDKHYIVSAALDADCIRSVLEAMACGLKPIIHNFPGADALIPAEFLFNISEQFCDQAVAGGYDPQRYRDIVWDRYPLQAQMARVDSILGQLEAETCTQHGSGPSLATVHPVAEPVCDFAAPSTAPGGSDAVSQF